MALCKRDRDRLEIAILHLRKGPSTPESRAAWETLRPWLDSWVLTMLDRTLANDPDEYYERRERAMVRAHKENKERS